MSGLPNGYKTVDKSLVKGRLKDPSPLDKGMRSLLVKDKDIRNNKDAEEKAKPPIAKVKSLSDIISNNIQAANDLRTITHYIKRAEQIWTTLLLKPNGDQKQLLIYDSESTDIKNGKLHELLIRKVESYFTSRYPIEETIPQIIKDVLFRTGSYVLFNMSHPALDHLINGMEVNPDDVTGNESLMNKAYKDVSKHYLNGDLKTPINFGYIRKEKKKDNLGGFESIYGGVPSREPEYNLLHEDLKFTFTDNPIVLKTAKLGEAIKEARLRSLSGTEGIEKSIRNVFRKDPNKRRKVNNNHVNAVSNKTFQEEIKSLYPDRHYDENESISIRKSKFYSGRGRGQGITFHWPSEAVINVSLNGQVGKHFGHILLTDPETGSPLKNTSDVKFYQKAKGSGAEASQPKMGTMNELISHIRSIADGKECDIDLSWMIEFGSATLEKELMEGFINGDLGKDVSISLSEDNKKLYWSRAMRDQGVRAIFVPAEYVTYIAIDYNKLGFGVSLVEEAKMQIGRLAVLDTADALAQVENAISHTLMTISLEKEDLDPRNVVAMIRDEYFANNPTLHDILGYNNVSIDAVLDRFKEQSLTIKVEANDNPYIISPQIEARQMEREPLKSIDRETRENLLNAIAGRFVLKRSWMEDTGDGNDFQVEALAEQELLRNQTMEFSRIFSSGITDFMRKHIAVNEPLINELAEIIRDNKKLYMNPDQTGNLDLDDEIKEALEGKSPEESQSENANDDLKANTAPKKKKKDEEVVEETSEVDEDEPTDAEIVVMETVLSDFLNNFYVLLPTPAITEALNKIDDKLDAIDKLVDRWVEMGGGAKLMKRRAEEAGMDPETIIDSVRAVLINEAFTRFNLPMPFEAILNSGKAGGILNIVNHVTDLDMNVNKFLNEWLKGTKKTKGMFERLKLAVEKAGSEVEDEIDDQGNVKPAPSSEFEEQTDLGGNGEEEGISTDENKSQEIPTETDGNKTAGQLEEQGGIGGDGIAKTSDDIFGS